MGIARVTATRDSTANGTSRAPFVPVGVNGVDVTTRSGADILTARVATRVLPLLDTIGDPSTGVFIPRGEWLVTGVLGPPDTVY